MKVIVCGAGIGELALHFLNRLDILVLKVLSKFDLRRLCRVTGATPLARIGAPTPEEAGKIAHVETIEIGADRLCVFRQAESDQTKTATIVLRGATTNSLDDLERAIDDATGALRSLIKDPRLLPGAGATEIQLSKRIQQLGDRTPGLNQHAIKAFAEALLVVPRTLAESAGLVPTEVLAKLSARQGSDNFSWGVDIEVSFLPCFSPDPLMFAF